MAEIIQTKNRKGAIRYSWKCEDCTASAGAWPQEQTAKNSAELHEVYCATRARCQVISKEPHDGKDTSKIQCIFKDWNHKKHRFPALV